MATVSAAADDGRAADGRAAAARVDVLLAERTRANEAFFEREAERLARLCHRMAERFAVGGRLLALGRSPAARSDARHVAVEFVHPVIVGKRALPALALAAEGGSLTEQLALAAEPADMAVAFETDAETDAALALARERGCLTLAFATGGPAEWELAPDTSADPFVRQELAETAYHVLWELVHVFFDHRGLLGTPGGAGEGMASNERHDGSSTTSRDGVSAARNTAAAPPRDGGASAFLYPFLGEQPQDDLESVVADVAASARMKADEVGELRARTLAGHAGVLAAAAAELRARLDAGGRVLALGNGGSATDAMDLVADLRVPHAGGPPRRALDLTEDAAILTAIANDIGSEAIFARQVIAHARPGDALVALTTSGSSLSVLAALREARARGLTTLALTGYDGGRIAAEQLADHVVVVPSEHIPRIQEAQASVWHVLRELLETVDAAAGVGADGAVDDGANGSGSAAEGVARREPR